MPRTLPRAVLASLAALALGGCHLEQRYLVPAGGGLYGAAITDATPAFIEGEEDSLYMVEARVDFPIHAPTDAEMDALWEGDAAPFPRLPWVAVDDFDTEIDLVVSNLEAEPVVATVTVNAINEFNEYTPGAQIIDRDVVVDFANWERTYALDPGERISVTVRAEELREAAFDLASVVNGMECMLLANQIVYFRNQHDHDPRSAACVPGTTIPGLVGVKIGLRTMTSVSDTAPDGTTSTHGANVVVEAAIRLRDLRDRVAATSEEPWELPEQPVSFTPPIPVEMP